MPNSRPWPLRFDSRKRPETDPTTKVQLAGRDEVRFPEIYLVELPTFIRQDKFEVD